MSGAITAITMASAGIGAAGSIGSSLIGANAAGKAASAASAAANKAADYTKQNSQQALDFQNQQYNNSQAQQKPYLDAGSGGLNALQYGLGTGGTANGSGVGQGSLLTPYSSFTAPTGLTEENDPGYQARLQLGTDALQKSAAARGSVLTGGTAKALDSYAQDYASNEYGNVYNRALNSYNTNANNYYTGQNNQYTRLANLTNLGSTTATNMANQGQAASNNVTNNLLGTAQQVGNDYMGAGNATASGYMNQANAYMNGLSGISNSASYLGALSQLPNNGSGYANIGNTGKGYMDGVYGGNWQSALNSPAPTLGSLNMPVQAPNLYASGGY